MSKNLVEKIISEHFVENTAEGVNLRIDQTLTQDATGTMAYLQFESLGIGSIHTESFSYIDHNTIQQGFENADDHAYLKSFAKKYGLTFSKAGNGICHQVHLERFAKPGKTLLGSDSHTPTAGAMGCLAIGVGGLDIALSMAGVPYQLKKPEIINIQFLGELHEFSCAKDIILVILSKLKTTGNVGKIIEYGGDVSTLSIPERATITNMGAELGVTTSIFPSDEITRRFLKLQNRESDWISIEADSDASYDEVIYINLDEIEPMVAKPDSPANVSKAYDLNVEVDQVCIGSCTNSSIRDLMIASEMLNGRNISEKASLIITPGSMQTMDYLSRKGALTKLINSGARVTESMCGFCIGASHAPGTNQVSLRTSNRNFKGRSGTLDSEIYLSGVEVAVASALTGRITNPKKLNLEYPKIDEIDELFVDDSQFIRLKEPDCEIIRGPNIGKPFVNKPLPKDIQGVVTIKCGDDVTTDHIMPAGSKMKYRSNIAKYSEFVFHNINPGFYKKALQNQKKGTANIVVAGEGYGQGSSREHAAICPAYLGVKIVIAKSIERIHRTNLINFGILPVTFQNSLDYDEIKPDDELIVEDIQEKLGKDGVFPIINETQGKECILVCDLDNAEKAAVLEGGMLNKVKKSIGK